jgi:uncharacterized membrane protein
MLYLVVGLLLWSGAHLFKRLLPEQRARLGQAGRGLSALLILASLWFLIEGYGMLEKTPLWGRHSVLDSINLILVVFAVYLMVASVLKPVITTRIRHPQLTALKSWALGHLLVNGDVPSIILFGGLMAWGVVSVILINKQSGKPPLSAPGGAAREVATVVLAAGLFYAMTWLHAAAGFPVAVWS